MTAAYEGALIDLGVTNRDDPITELIAKYIVNVTATGARDPVLIKERAINALGVRRPRRIVVRGVRFRIISGICSVKRHVRFPRKRTSEALFQMSAMGQRRALMTWWSVNETF